jgi:hypothetical protein
MLSQQISIVVSSDSTDGVPAKYNHLISTEPCSHNSSACSIIVAILRKLILCGKFR